MHVWGLPAIHTASVASGRDDISVDDRAAAWSVPASCGAAEYCNSGFDWNVAAKQLYGRDRRGWRCAPAERQWRKAAPVTLLSRYRSEVLERIAPDLVRPLHVVERETIESAMILCQGNVGVAAKRLGMSRETLYRRLKLWRKEDA
jgi:DNA-binding NtrC family response regulator